MSWSEPANWSNQKKRQSKYNKKPITVLNIGKLPKVQKDAGKQVVDGFSFALNWLRKKHKFSEAITVWIHKSQSSIGSLPTLKWNLP